MGTKIPTILITDRIWIPAKKVDIDKAEKLYRTQLFNENMCRKCEYKEDRVCDVCLECEGFLGDYKLYKEQEINGRSYIGVPTGNRSKLKKLVDLSDFKVLDQRTEGKSFKKAGLKFYSALLYEYQKVAQLELLKANGGLLKSAPRTGKTVMAVSAILKVARKTIIIVHQDDLLKQFHRTFYNMPKGVSPKFTNIPQRERETGKTYVGFCRTFEDFKKHDICLCTYQTFISPGGKKLLKKIIKLNWGMVIVDEIHRANADCFSKVVNSFMSRRRYGLTATPKRKDGKDFIIRDIVGPVVAETTAKPMKMKIDVVETGLHTNRNYRVWAYAMRFLNENKKRNDMIVRHAVKEVKKGRSIVIPITIQKHADLLVRQINYEYGKNVAAKFTGNISKDARIKVLSDATEGKIKCVVAMRSMLTGVNVPRWDTIFEVVPINNEPNLEQELLRVCTPYEGKKSPMVRWFVDDFTISRSCFANSVRHMKGFAKRLGGFKYTTKGEAVTRKYMAVYYAKQKARSGPNDEDEFKPQNTFKKGEKSNKSVTRKSSARKPMSGPLRF